MAITPLDGDLTAGMAGKRTEDINPSPAAFITGDNPGVWSEALPVGADLVLAARTVVALNASGHIVAAEADNDPKAIGILAYAVDTTGIAAGVADAEVYRGGCFNPDLLVWPASFNTDALKLAAFRGSPSPTVILLRRPLAMTL